jgi:hypothetical protein
MQLRRWRQFATRVAPATIAEVLMMQMIVGATLVAVSGFSTH